MKKITFYRKSLAITLCGLLLNVGIALAANVAKIGDTEYATLQAAVNAANSYSSSSATTITLLSNLGDEGAKIDGKNIILDMAGYTHDRTDSYYTYCLYVLGKSKVTVKNGTITMDEKNNDAKESDKVVTTAIRMQGGSTLNLDNVKSTGGCGLYCQGDGNTININSCTIKGLNKYGLNILDNTNKVTISGSSTTIEGTLYAVNFGEGKNGELTVNDGTLTGETMGIRIYSATYATIKVNGGTIKGKAAYGICFTDGYSSYSAKSSSTTYGVGNKLEISGGTITTDGTRYPTSFTASVCLDENNVAVTLTGDAQLTAENSQYGILQYGNNTSVTADENFTGKVSGTSSAVYLWGNNNSFTANNGTFNGGTNSVLVGISSGDGYPNSSNTVNISGGTYTTTTWAVAYVGKNNSINLSGGEFSALGGLAGNGTDGLSGNTITVTGGTFNAKASSSAGAQGMYFPNNDNVSITNAEINVTGNGQGVVARGGTVTLGDGVNITTNGTGTTTAGDNSTQLQSAAVVFDASTDGYTGLTDDSKISITGGTYTSADGVTPVQVVKTSSNTGDYVSITDGTFSSSVDEYAAASAVLVETDGTTQYVTDKNLSLTDGNYTSFRLTGDVTGKTVTYARHLYSSWNAWYMPFDVKQGDVDGVQFYEISTTETPETKDDGKTYFTITPLSSGATVTANKPYVVKPTAETEGDFTFTASNANLYKEDSSSEPKTDIAISDNNNTYTFTGLYTRKNPTADDLGWYVVGKSGNLSKRATAGESHGVNPFRFILTVTDKSTGSKAFSAPALMMKVGNTATGIKAVKTQNGTDDIIYDLQGRRITAPTKGIYIVNGRKVVIK